MLFKAQSMHSGSVRGKEVRWIIIADGEQVGSPVKTQTEAEVIAEWINASINELKLKFKRGTDE